MQAHVPIIATDFPEIRKVVSTYKTGRVTDSKDPKVLAKIITEMLNEKVDDNLFENALANFSWEKEAETLIKIYK
jgi:glycosyltransferase involved in cell wall biosynthesis